MSEKLLPMLSSRIFLLGLTFRCLTHFEFTFVYGVRKFHLFACSSAVFQTPFVEETVFLLYILAAFVED